MPDYYTPTGTFERRAQGQSRTGIVSLYNFDRGVITTLKAQLIDDNYFLTNVLPVEAPTGLPGIPIVFAFPEDLFERYKLPVVVIRRDDISPAMNRWHPGMDQYRTPAKTAKLRTAVIGNPGVERQVSDFDRYESLAQAVPFDITYTISILARHRGYGPGVQTPTGLGSPRNQVNRLLDYVLRIYQPFSQVRVEDSLGDTRGYEAFMEAVSHLDEMSEVGDRVLGFAVTLRVEAEMDVNEPLEATTVMGQAQINL